MGTSARTPTPAPRRNLGDFPGTLSVSRCQANSCCSIDISLSPRRPTKMAQRHESGLALVHTQRKSTSMCMVR
eukprot:358192-Chlamydomonas_euryale.AAC.12